MFVDGRMWHGYDWEHQKNDFKSNREYWIPKIEDNRERDLEVTQELIDLVGMFFVFGILKLNKMFPPVRIK